MDRLGRGKAKPWDLLLRVIDDLDGLRQVFVS